MKGRLMNIHMMNKICGKMFDKYCGSPSKNDTNIVAYMRRCRGHSLYQQMKSSNELRVCKLSNVFRNASGYISMVHFIDTTNQKRWRFKPKKARSLRPSARSFPIATINNSKLSIIRLTRCQIISTRNRSLGLLGFLQITSKDEWLFRRASIFRWHDGGP